MKVIYCVGMLCLPIMVAEMVILVSVDGYVLNFSM